MDHYCFSQRHEGLLQNPPDAGCRLRHHGGRIFVNADEWSSGTAADIGGIACTDHLSGVDIRVPGVQVPTTGQVRLFGSQESFLFAGVLWTLL